MTSYGPTVWSTAKVPLDYLITDGKNKYSVPFDLIGMEVDIRLTKATVKVFFHGSRVASHPRVSKQFRDAVTQLEHMPMEHRKHLSYNADEFIRWAQTVVHIERFLSSGREPEQGYKSCASLTKLDDRYSLDRLGLLVDAEWNRHQANRLARYIKNAHFSAPNATIDGY